MTTDEKCGAQSYCADSCSLDAGHDGSHYAAIGSSPYGEGLMWSEAPHPVVLAIAEVVRKVAARPTSVELTVVDRLCCCVTVRISNQYHAHAAFCAAHSILRAESVKYPHVLVVVERAQRR